MKTEQTTWTASSGWNAASELGGRAQLVLTFGSRGILEAAGCFDRLRQRYPKALIVGCSTAGEIRGTQVLDDSLVVTAVRFDHTPVQLAHVSIEEGGDSSAIGRRLAESLPSDELSHVMVFSDGLKVNGSELTRGMRQALPHSVAVTGGLSADGARFERTLVCADAVPTEGVVAAIGLYGSNVKVGYGSFGGWDSFGPERLITRSKDNVLYELDGQSALGLYKKYLGEHAQGLPATGLLFPLSLRVEDGTAGLVRTILAVDEEEQSMTFAGDMPEGAYARLMKANFERLIDGAHSAAEVSNEPMAGQSPDLAILISCVGRKLVLKQRVEEEVERVREVVGDRTVLAGFYSYGEICPVVKDASCELHNQTMTITTFRED